MKITKKRNAYPFNATINIFKDINSAESGSSNTGTVALYISYDLPLYLIQDHCTIFFFGEKASSHGVHVVAHLLINSSVSNCSMESKHNHTSSNC